MYTKITSTQLKQKTREMIEMVKDSGPAIVYTYNEPVAVLVDYEEYKKPKKKMDLKDLKKLAIKGGKKFDGVKLFKEIGDEE